MLLSDFGFTQYNYVSILFINGFMTTSEAQHLFHPQRPSVITWGVNLQGGEDQVFLLPLAASPPLAGDGV